MTPIDGSNGMLPLFDLTDVGFGGWPTFTGHLYQGLFEMQPVLFKIGKRTESQVRNYGRGLRYRNISMEDAVRWASNYPSLITAVGAKKRAEAEVLVSAGASIVLHDPTELKGGMIDVFKAARRCVVVRKVNQQLIPGSVYIPHPYKRMGLSGLGVPVVRHAVAYSRVDFDKYTHIIAEANTLIDYGLRIHIWGAENRMYAHHKLDKDFPSWRNNYHGRFSADDLWGGVRLAQGSRWVVDLSQIKGDGGGTQYTHLEAFDAGRPLILHEDWLTRPDGQGDELSGAATFVRTPADLVRTLIGHTPGGPSLAGTILEAHNARDVGQRYVALLTSAVPAKDAVGQAELLV